MSAKTGLRCGIAALAFLVGGGRCAAGTITSIADVSLPAGFTGPMLGITLGYPYSPVRAPGTFDIFDAQGHEFSFTFDQASDLLVFTPRSNLPSSVKLDTGSLIAGDGRDLIFLLSNITLALYIFNDTTRSAFQGPFAFLGGPTGMAFDPNQGQLYVADEGRLDAFDLNTGDTPQIADTTAATAIAVGPNGLLYALDATDALVEIFDPHTGALQSSFSIPGNIDGSSFAVGQDGRVYLAGAGLVDGGGFIYSSDGTLLDILSPGAQMTSNSAGRESMALDEVNGNLFLYAPNGGFHVYDVSSSTTPEPSAGILFELGLGLMSAVGLWNWQRKRSHPATN